MMEPRWKPEWAGVGSVFIGGTNTYDLWVDTERDLRVVRGSDVFDWDYFTPTDKGLKQLTKDMRPRKSSCGSVMPMTCSTCSRCSDAMEVSPEDLEEIMTYLTLFVPDWQERSRGT